MPTGALFRAVKELDVNEVERLLQDGEYKEAVDEEDGDGFAALFTLALSNEATLDDAKSIVMAFKSAGADFVKTSTGFAEGGATEEAVQMMLDTAAGRVKVKPSGGIRDRARAVMFVEMGAMRIGNGYTSTKAIPLRAPTRPRNSLSSSII